MTVTIVRENLTVFDRCDRCGVQARVRASFVSGDLYFCGHHAQKYDIAQKAFGIELFDAQEKFRFEQEKPLG